MTDDRDMMDVSGAEATTAPAGAVAETETATAADSVDDDARPLGDVVQAENSALEPNEIERLSTDIVAALKTVYDPEIPVDIYELGLIYKVDIDDNRYVNVDMTLTAPGCPVAGEMPIWVEGAISMVEGVSGVTANMVFDPPWDVSRMSDEARVALNMW